MGRSRIHFSLSEENVELTPANREGWLSLFLAEDFGTYEEIELNKNFAFEGPGYVKYEKAILENFLLNNSKGRLILRSNATAHDFEGNLRVHFAMKADGIRNIINLLIDREDFLEKNGVEKLWSFIKRSAHLFTKINSGTCSPATNYHELYQELKLKPIVAKLGMYVQWIHIIGPSIYEQFYKKEDLLTAPAYKVEEWDNGVIMIMSYPDPFSIDSQETRERIIKLTNYLNEKATIVQW